ncbi:MAG: helix-turn-helix domain-containing protein [Chloroflexi bacterium]|nr:MAG: helix-turn-helix domain-containing protein [Chloroflexota bacterium]
MVAVKTLLRRANTMRMKTSGEEPARRPPAVGRQIRRWRAERGLTLAKVAEASGLNVGYLSQIENDKASPSLSCLSALSSALDVPIAWFLADETRPPEVTRLADRRWRETPGGRASRVDARGSSDISIIEVNVEPGRGTGVHSHTGDEHHLVTAGRFRLTQGDHVTELGPGDYLRWDGLVPHDAEAIGDTPGSMLIIRLTRHGEPHD